MDRGLRYLRSGLATPSIAGWFLGSRKTENYQDGENKCFCSFPEQVKEGHLWPWMVGTPNMKSSWHHH